VGGGGEKTPPQTNFFIFLKGGGIFPPEGRGEKGVLGGALFFPPLKSPK